MILLKRNNCRKSRTGKKEFSIINGRTGVYIEREVIINIITEI